MTLIDRHILQVIVKADYATQLTALIFPIFCILFLYLRQSLSMQTWLASNSEIYLSASASQVQGFKVSVAMPVRLHFATIY